MTPPAPVHVVLVVPPAEVRDGDRRCLTGAEQYAAERLRVPAARARHVAGRAWARRVLAARLGCAPDEVPLVATAQGAPVVVGHPTLHLSVSHTPGLVVVALAEDRRVGVDVERRDRRTLPPPTAWLHAEELAELADHARVGRDALLERWTAKEAVAKALGTGLGAPLRAISLAGGHVAAPDTQVEGWELARLDVPRTHVGTVATVGQTASGQGRATQKRAPPRSASSTHASPPCAVA